MSVSINLESHQKAFHKVGWFIPPFVQLGFLSQIKVDIESGIIKDPFGLEPYLAQAYSPVTLAAMVVEYYPNMPIVSDYKHIIAEAVEAHFLGLAHNAVSGLVPAIEGIAEKLRVDRSLPEPKKVKELFGNLIADCRSQALTQQIGAVDEILTMLQSFLDFTRDYLFRKSVNFPLPDKMNRHGVLHGAYTDGTYNSATNFYKVISSVDFLCMMSNFKGHLSWFAPSPTPKSLALTTYYVACNQLGRQRPKI